MRSPGNVEAVAACFDLGGRLVAADRYGKGHINDTYILDVDRLGSRARYVLQRINEHVFRRPQDVMENIERVTAHLADRSSQDELCLTLVPTREGASFHLDESGYWRVYPFIEGTRTYDIAPDNTIAAEAAARFGRFQQLLDDLPGPPLHETIPAFHDTPARYKHLREAIISDAKKRAASCSAEIGFAQELEEVAGTLMALQDTAELPQRIAHNDTKLNNVLFDKESGRAVCVIDLDTVMPGTVLCDFGDLVRSAAGKGSEDTTDLASKSIDMILYRSLVEGYLGATGRFLTAVEINHLAVSGLVITLETGVRFLTDYLCGDQYFRIQRPNQNLHRCRAQFALAASIRDRLDEMQEMTERIAGSAQEPDAQ